MEIVDISNPATPVRIRIDPRTLKSGIRGLSSYGSFLGVLGNDDNLYLFDAGLIDEQPAMWYREAVYSIPARTGSPQFSSPLPSFTLTSAGACIGVAVPQLTPYGDPSQAAQGLHTISIPNVDAKLKIGEAILGAAITDVEASGQQVFAIGLGGILVSLDTSDPTQPRLQGITITADNNIQFLRDQYLTLGNSWGWETYDVSLPAKPTKVGANTSIKGPKSTICGSFAYAIDGSSAMQVVSISDPAPMKVVAAVNLNGRIDGITSSDHYIYVGLSGVAGTSGGVLAVLNATDPLNPVKVGEITWANNNYVYELRTQGQYLYAKMSNSLNIVDVSVPTSPKVVGSLVINLPGDYRPVGDRLYFTTGASVGVVDISDPTNPRLVQTIPMPMRPEDRVPILPMSVSGENVFVAAGTSGVFIFGPTPTPELAYTGQLFVSVGGIDLSATPVGKSPTPNLDLKFKAQGVSGGLYLTNTVVTNVIGCASVRAVWPAGVYEVSVTDAGGRPYSKPTAVAIYNPSKKGDAVAGTIVAGAGRQVSLGMLCEAGPAPGSMLLVDPNSGARVVSSSLRRTKFVEQNAVYSGICSFQAGSGRSVSACVELIVGSKGNNSAASVRVKRSQASQDALYEASGPLKNGGIRLQ